MQSGICRDTFVKVDASTRVCRECVGAVSGFCRDGGGVGVEGGLGWHTGVACSQL